MDNNFYIFSTGRSGSTLLQHMLDAHPNMVVPPESFFVLELYNKYKNERSWSEKTRHAFIADLAIDLNFQRVWKITKEELQEAFTHCGNINNYGEACNVVRSTYRNAYLFKNIKLFGDKKPFYARYPSLLLRVHPHAKLVHLIRDPRGTANGRKNSFHKQHVGLSAVLWNHLNRNLLHLKKKYPDRYYRIHYEHLVTQTEEALRDLCHFLTIEFNEEMLHYREHTEKLVGSYIPLIRNKHQSLMKPIDPGMIEKWREGLTENEVREINWITKPLAGQLNYNLPQEKPTFIMKWRCFRFTVKYLVITNFMKFLLHIPFGWRKQMFRLLKRY